VRLQGRRGLGQPTAEFDAMKLCGDAREQLLLDDGLRQVPHSITQSASERSTS